MEYLKYWDIYSRGSLKELMEGKTLIIALFLVVIHCRPVKQAVSADKGMILNAVLAI